MALNGGLSFSDLLSKSIALSPMREEQGIIRAVFFIDLGQNAFDTVASCSLILNWDTWSRCVQMTAFALLLKSHATSSGRHLQLFPGNSLKEIIGTISFESEATRRTRDSKPWCWECDVRFICYNIGRVLTSGEPSMIP